ncbi:MAG TPA: glycosyl hydrolase, partial [Thermomicrobiales bacterium]|nr:glycosyl hydrolase [Thermomicrobiales bacterium]
ALFSSALFTFLVIATFVDHIRANLKSRVSLGRAIAGATPIAVVAALLLQGILLGGSLNRVEALEALTYNPRTAGVDRLERGALGGQEPSPSTPLVLVSPTAAPTATVVPTATIAPTPAPRLVESWLFDVNRSGMTFGAYDPKAALRRMSNLDHLFTAWLDDSTGGVPMAEIRASYDRGTPVMLSWEPWPTAGRESDSIVEDTIAGAYDPLIRRAARSVEGFQQPILIRVGHEMDMDGLYPWAGAAPDRFIAMYRHTIDIFREEGATNVLWVWSPAGISGAPLYYPGDAYVDYIGLTILEYSGWESAAGHAAPREFKELVNEKYQMMRLFDKPILLAEVGIDLPAGLKAESVRQMIAVTEWFPKIRGVVYFNDRNPVTPIIQDRPQWSLSPADRAILSSALSAADWFETGTTQQ